MRPLLLLLLALGLIVGCRTPSPRPVARSESGPVNVRNTAYSLLAELLNQQKRVGLLLLIKREENDVRLLVRRIAAASSEGAALLERFAQEDPSLSLQDTWLPPGEAETREAIALTTRERLLEQSGADFELTLLLAQIQAVNYAAHLAKVATQADKDVERVQSVRRLQREMEGFYLEIFELIRSRSGPTPSALSG